MAANANGKESRTPRELKLRKQFPLFLRGERKVDLALDGQHFFEAVCLQDSASTCIEHIITSNEGLKAVHDAFRRDLRAEYIQTHAVRFLLFLSEPAVKSLNGGSFLHKILHEIVEPRTFWDALLGHFENSALDERSIEALAWLCLELLSLPTSPTEEVVEKVRKVSQDGRFLKSQSQRTRCYGYKLEKLLRLLDKSGHAGEPGGPGGRHDNDHEDFREIAIYPTRDELLYAEMPYYRLASEVAETPMEDRARAHLENQFRLLREDMLGELRNDIQLALGIKKRGRRTATVLSKLFFDSIDFQTRSNADGRVSLLLQCEKGLESFSRLSEKDKKAFLASNASSKFLKHQSFGAFCCDKELLAFGFIFRSRDDTNLLKKTPVVEIQMPDVDSLRKVLESLLQGRPLDFALVDTAVFAYEPVLTRLKRIKELPLDTCLLNTSSAGEIEFQPKPEIQRLIEELKLCLDKTRCIIGKNPVDKDQLQSIIDALSRPVSAILGPPGTGKSYVGALIVNLVLKHGMRVLVLSYTNHALDQFLTDLYNVGIQKKYMVRLGSKSIEETAELSLEKQHMARIRKTVDWGAVNQLNRKIDELKEELKEATKALERRVTDNDILEYIEFGDMTAYEALVVPSEAITGQGVDQYITVGEKRRRIQAGYLLNRWQHMKGPFSFSDRMQGNTGLFWKMSQKERASRLEKWVRSITEERLAEITRLGEDLSGKQKYLETLMTRPKRATLNEKKVIGCTTTAAAKYHELIAATNVDMVLVEEAGEILEAHVLTALAPSVRQLVLIGDHKQLRPKINNYELSVEKGTGYDLNRSLFERLILQNHHYSQLKQQHRMHPNISALPRTLTYPELKDGPRTVTRDEPRGIRGRVIFVNHEKPEKDFVALADRQDNGATMSKQNKFEAQMVLKLVKYLGQQGYGTRQLVILTPYLAQLRLLRDTLSHENDPVLTDLDSHELRRAGLLTDAAAKVGKKQIRISTIDNYQGEESDIVVISFTRSNSRGDIGFLSSPERVNVALTRARQAVIMIGHMDTFLKSKKGRALWTKLFNALKEGGYLHDGVPVECQQHPGTTSLLCSPEDFDKYCPEGGCTEPCAAPLPCGLHKCSRPCHRMKDHSKVVCTELIEKTCDRGHKTRVHCGNQARTCADCVKEDADTRRRAQRDLDLEMKRRAAQAAYERERDQVRDDLDHMRRQIKYEAEEVENKKTLESEKSTLKKLKELRLSAKKRREWAEKKAVDSLDAQKKREEKTKNPVVDKEQSAGQAEDWHAPETAKEEWEYMKVNDGESSAPLDTLMEMIGLEVVKAEFLGIKSRVDAAINQGVSFSDERFNCSLLGNPGTGKTTIARIYGQFLMDVGVIPGAQFEETTGSKLASMGVQGCQDLLEKVLDDGGGVVFIDEAYQLTSGNSPGGKAVLDFLLAEVENLTGKVVFVLAGYTKQMESFFAHNPGLPSRFPNEMKFEDYTDEELLRILKLKIEKTFSSGIVVEDGPDGLFCRIVSRRLGRGRGREGFGNARDVENALVRIRNRQSGRIRKEKRAGSTPDYHLLTKEDVIGPEPSAALHGCKAWGKLNKLIGLQSVKDAVRVLVDTMQTNYQRELAEEPPVDYTLNKVFLGSPGTGKTTVAKLYGQILVDIGLLSNGEVVVKNPSDFVGAHIGESEKLTKGILASTVGKVLVIDEAYGLDNGSSKGYTDPFKTAVIDTIVAEVQSTPGEDRCVLLLGYKEQMEEMFEKVNPGLSRRFPISSAFTFEDFTQEELGCILELKLKESGFKATDQGKRVALEVLDRARNRPNFGNAGEVDILLNSAKGRHQKRVSTGATKRSELEAVDFDEEFDRAERSETNIGMLFKGTVGCDKIVSTLEGYQAQVRALKKHDLDPKEGVPFTFLFRGPPGTGKTSTAKKMGKVFYDMGFLAKAEVVECSASDLVGQYVGHTGPQVRKKLDNALGRVLFIDEAYRLAEGHFAKEAVDELVDCLTKERYQGKMVVVLAGYDDDINRLLSVNPGLSSRFSEVISFNSLAPEKCIGLLVKRLEQKKDKMKSKAKLDLSALEPMDPRLESDLYERFKRLAELKGWANARDVETLAKSIFGKVIKREDGPQLVVSGDIVKGELDTMYEERKKRDEVNPRVAAHYPVQFRDSEPRGPATPTSTKTSTSASDTPPSGNPDGPKQKASDKGESSIRDAGVSDEVWGQLEQDKQAEAARKKRAESLRRKLASEASEALRQRIVDELIEEEERMKKEAEEKKRLHERGLCPAGFEWIRQEGGYRCAGGAHFVGDGDIA